MKILRVLIGINFLFNYSFFSFILNTLALYKNIPMKKFLLFISAISFFAACNFKKATTVNITNKNNYALSIKLDANNVTTGDVKIEANSKKEVMLDWTNIDKKDGSYSLAVNHIGQGVDTFSHGFFTAGELTNYLDIIVENHQVKVSASE
jgi:hypothetical protein